MINSKLLKLYLKLDKDDLTLFRKWVQSPLHVNHKDVKALFTFIDTRKNLKAVTLQKKRAWNYIYSTQKYNDTRLRYIMSLALKTLTDFVGYKNSIEDRYTYNKSLANYFYEQQMLKQSSQYLSLAQNEIAPPLNALYHYQQFNLERLKLKIEGGNKWNRSTNIPDITRHARLFFMITTLRHACIALSHQNIKKEDYSIPMLDVILTEIEKGVYQDEIILMIYYHGYYALKKLDAANHFTALKDFLLNHPNTLAKDEQKEVLLMAINYCIKQLNSGSFYYIREAFELYKYGLNNTCLSTNNKLTLFTYANIVSLGLNLKEFSWIEQFIPTYSKYLNVENPQNYEYHNTARLEFARGNFDKTMALLTQVEYDDLFLNITAKVILLKIYYQEQYYDALEALINSFRVFLNRKKVLSYHKTNFMNLIKLTKKLLYIYPDKKSIRKLKKQIEETDPLTERKWLLEQLDLIG